MGVPQISIKFNILSKTMGSNQILIVSIMQMAFANIFFLIIVAEFLINSNHTEIDKGNMSSAINSVEWKFTILAHENKF